MFSFLIRTDSDIPRSGKPQSRLLQGFIQFSHMKRGRTPQTKDLGSLTNAGPYLSVFPVDQSRDRARHCFSRAKLETGCSV